MIGIQGYGVVGEALHNALKAFGNKYFLIQDPAKYKFDLIYAANDGCLLPLDFLFYCVNEPDGRVKHTEWFPFADIIVIKTTVALGEIKRLQELFPNKSLVYMPEFLDEDNAVRDMLNPDKVILGSTDKEAALKVFGLFNYGESTSWISDPEEAELAKLAINAFYSTKVTFWNTVYDLARAIGADYNLIKRFLKIDRYNDGSHMEIHHKGYRGFGGKCLPKDLEIILEGARNMREGRAKELFATLKTINADYPSCQPGGKHEA